jgi:hypothetical protein
VIAVLVIPAILIWKIRATWGQKIALTLTLCLTIVMIVITIMRIVGLKRGEVLDYIWESYFTAIAAEIGLTLVALTAFRSLYVSKAQKRNVQSPIATFNWYKKGRAAMVQIAGKVTGNADSRSDTLDTDKNGEGFIRNNIPHATMTGVRSYIDKSGKTVQGTGTGDMRTSP